ncbi:MAG: metal-dependent hydrolase [bacterium]
MANFKTHLSCGVVLGVICALVAVIFALIGNDWRDIFLIELFVILGAVMPDMDSDSGVPFHVAFGSLAIISAGFAVFYALTKMPGNYTLLISYPLGAIFLVWVVAGHTFKRLTKHRGMAHSIPAAALAGFVVFSGTARIGFSEWESFLFAASVAIGYILHLTLDELYSATNFHGHPFVPNKAFGSALKLFSHNHAITVFVYGLLWFFYSVNGTQISVLGTKLFQMMK